MQPANTYSQYPQGDRLGMRKPKMDKHQHNHSYHRVHLPNPVSNDLTIKSVLTKPVGKDWVRGWSM